MSSPNPSPTPKHIQEYRGWLKSALTETTRDISSLKRVREDAQEYFAALIYATILQSSNEAFSLLSQPTLTVSAIVRGIYESYADLCAVLLDSKYGQRMLATFEEQRVYLFESMTRRPNNRFHAVASPHVDPGARLTEARTNLDQLKRGGFTPLATWERFKAAGLSDLYDGVYWQLCLKAHNNLGALEMRHVIKRADGAYSLVAVQPNGLVELINYLEPLTGIVLDSTIKIHTLLDSSSAQHYRDRLQEFNHFRAQVRLDIEPS